MYADDTTLLTSSSDPLTLETDLKRSLDMVANWFNSNQLTLNIKKTKLMMFGTWQALTKFKDIRLTYDNNIEIVDKFKYLGVVFDPHLSWTKHVNYMVACRELVPQIRWSCFMVHLFLKCFTIF